MGREWIWVCSVWRIGHIWEKVDMGSSWYGYLVHMGLVYIVLVDMGLVGMGLAYIWAIMLIVSYRSLST